MDEQNATQSAEQAENEVQRKVLKRDEVLALLHDCYELLSNRLCAPMDADELTFLNYSFKLADVYSDLQNAKDVSTVDAIGFKYEECEEEETDEDEEEYEDEE